MSRSLTLAATVATALAALAMSAVARADSSTATITCDVGATPATLTVTPSDLWPPDHGMRTITFSLSLNADAGSAVAASLSLTSITDNQESQDDGNGGGCGQPASKQGLDWSPDVNTTPLIVSGSLLLATDALTTTMKIRSERCASLGDRIYTIGVECCDTVAQVCTPTTAMVTVKHSNGKGKGGKH